MGTLCKVEIMKFDSPLKSFMKKVVTVTFTCNVRVKSQKIEKINSFILMLLTLWSSHCIQWGLGSPFLCLKFHYHKYSSRYPGVCILVVLNMKMHENSDFRPVFVWNGRAPHGLYRYVTGVWVPGPLTSRYEVYVCRPVFE